MNEDQIRAIIGNEMDDKFQSFTNMTVPSHTHNHVDAPPVVMGDLVYDSRGLNFPMGPGRVSIVSDSGNDSGTFSITPPAGYPTDLVVGLGTIFNNITVQGADILLAVFGNTDQSDFEISQDHVRFGSTSAGWYMHLHVDDFSSLPASPDLGDIAFASTDGGLTGNLYVCQAPGIWTLK